MKNLFDKKHPKDELDAYIERLKKDPGVDWTYTWFRKTVRRKSAGFFSRLFGKK